MSKEQILLTQLILKLGNNLHENEKLLAEAATIRPKPNARITFSRCRQAKGNYFIGKLLYDRSNSLGDKYFRKAIRLNPFLFQAWLFLTLQFLLRKCQSSAS